MNSLHAILHLSHWFAALVIFGCSLNQLHDLDPLRTKQPSVVEYLHVAALCVAWILLALGAAGILAMPFLPPQDRPTLSDACGMTGFALVILLRGFQYRLTSKTQDRRHDDNAE